MRPEAAATIIRPVGVGLMSPGPKGAVGFTMITGIPVSSTKRFTSHSAKNFDCL